MKRSAQIALFVTLACSAPGAHAQADAAAAERARLADQRILAEAERRRKAAEEAQRQAEAAQAVSPAVSTTASPVSQALPATAAPVRQQPETMTIQLDADDAEIVRLLQHIRSLGELRDAGYVTDEEFERIKRKILDSAL